MVRKHQTIGNIICTFQIQQMDLDFENPRERVLSSTMFAIWSMVHTITQRKPSQSEFGRDAILNINQEANWQLIKHCIQESINKGNQKENLHRQFHVCHTGDKVLLKSLWKTKFNQESYTHTMTEVRNNGTVHTYNMQV